MTLVSINFNLMHRYPTNLPTPSKKIYSTLDKFPTIWGESMILTSPPKPSTTLQAIETTPTFRETIIVNYSKIPTSFYATIESILAATVTNVTLQQTQTSLVNPEQVANEKFQHLSDGVILYNPPKEMTVAIQEKVEARISFKDDEIVVEEMTEGLEGKGVPTTEPLSISSFMKVNLRADENDFNITSLSSEEQIIVRGEYTNWKWDVIPLRAGKKNLTLVVTARVKIQNYLDEQKDITTLEKRINVHVNTVHSATTFIDENLEWIFPFFLIPIGLWLYNRNKNKNQTIKNNKDAGSMINKTRINDDYE